MLVADHAREELPQTRQESVEVPAEEAGRLLGIGRTKLTQLLKEWEETGERGLPFHRSKLDHRVRLVKRSDIQALRERSQGVSVEEARRCLGKSHEKMRDLIEGGELPVRENPLRRNRRLVDPDRYAELLAESGEAAAGSPLAR